MFVLKYIYLSEEEKFVKDLLYEYMMNEVKY